MSAVTSHDRLVAAHQGSAFGPAAATLWQHLCAWLARRSLKAQLERLDERQLADIGLVRDDIPAIVAGTYRRI